MSRWTKFRCTCEEIPTDRYEAAVFIDNALHHLWNGRTHKEVRDAYEILRDAHQAINDSYREVA